MFRRALLIGACLQGIVATLSADSADDSFGNFWKEFRAAVLCNEQQAVSRMTRFPFEIRGPSDGEPIQKVSRAEFQHGVWKRVLNQTEISLADGKTIRRSKRSLIEVTLTPAAGDQQSDSFAFLLSLEFRRIGNKWLLTRAYLGE